MELEQGACLVQAVSGRREGPEGTILTKKVFTLPKAVRSSRSMWGRLVEKWVQLSLGRVLRSRLAPTPARRTRHHSSAELGMVELCCFCALALLVVWFCKGEPPMCSPSPTVSPFYIVGS